MDILNTALAHPQDTEHHIIQINIAPAVTDILAQGIYARRGHADTAHLQLLIDITIQEHLARPAANRKDSLWLKANHIILDGVSPLYNLGRIAITDLNGLP